MTTGILGLLDARELEGVLAHELMHVKNRDTLVGTVAATFGGAISFLAQMAMFSSLFGGGDDENSNPLAILGAVLLAPIAATLIQLAVSRSREHLADATGAALVGDPDGLAAALERLAAWQAAHARRGAGALPGRVAQPEREMNAGYAHLYLVNPLRGGDLARLFSTHPPLGGAGSSASGPCATDRQPGGPPARWAPDARLMSCRAPLANAAAPVHRQAAGADRPGRLAANLDPSLPGGRPVPLSTGRPLSPFSVAVGRAAPLQLSRAGSRRPAQREGMAVAPVVRPTVASLLLSVGVLTGSVRHVRGPEVPHWIPSGLESNRDSPYRPDRTGRPDHARAVRHHRTPGRLALSMSSSGTAPRSSVAAIDGGSHGGAYLLLAPLPPFVTRLAAPPPEPLPPCAGTITGSP